LSFEVLLALGVKITVFMDMMPSNFEGELVYPGHEESTSIGHEKAYNPYV